MLTNTKEAAKKPKITPIQLILFAVLMAWMVITNLSQFKDLSVSWQMGIQIGFYVAIMLTAGQKGSISSLVRSLIGIIVKDEPDAVKMLKLQNLVVAICQELGLLFEQEKQNFMDFVETKTNGEIAVLKENIKVLEDSV